MNLLLKINKIKLIFKLMKFINIFKYRNYLERHTIAKKWFQQTVNVGDSDTKEMLKSLE